MHILYHLPKPWLVANLKKLSGKNKVSDTSRAKLINTHTNVYENMTAITENKQNQ